MRLGPELPCPRCRRALGPESWQSADHGVCQHCQTEYAFVAFPALTEKPGQVTPQAAVLGADSSCFFHPENRAEVICEDCGRLLCPVCTVPFAGKKICPTCIAATRDSGAETFIRSRVLYDGTALTMAGLPMLFWPLTLVTAPLALGLVVYGWNKPGSLVRGRSRGRMLVATLLAVIQIVAWIVFLVVWLKKK